MVSVLEKQESIHAKQTERPAHHRRRSQSCPGVYVNRRCVCVCVHRAQLVVVRSPRARSCIAADPRLKSMTRTPAPDALRPTKSQPFSIIWEDNTDSVVDLRTLRQIMRNHEQGLHKPSTSIPPPTSNGARAQSTVVSQGAAAPSPSSALPPPQVHAPQAPAAAAASARAAPGVSIFDGVPSIPGDLVDLLTRNGTFAFLEDLHETGRLWDLRNFRIPRLVPRGAASRDFGDSLKAILALAERYPAQSLPLYILRAFAQFLPALLMPCSRRGKPRHVSLNARRFQKGSGSLFGIRH